MDTPSQRLFTNKQLISLMNSYCHEICDEQSGGHGRQRDGFQCGRGCHLCRFLGWNGYGGGVGTVRCTGGRRQYFDQPVYWRRQILRSQPFHRSADADPSGTNVIHLSHSVLPQRFAAGCQRRHIYHVGQYGLHADPADRHGSNPLCRAGMWCDRHLDGHDLRLALQICILLCQIQVWKMEEALSADIIKRDCCLLRQSLPWVMMIFWR